MPLRDAAIRILLANLPERQVRAIQQLIEEPRDNKNWKGPYLKGEIPKDPWGQPYVYECPGRRNNSKSYDLASIGPDGREGTEDDVANWQTSNK